MPISGLKAHRFVPMLTNRDGTYCPVGPDIVKLMPAVAVGARRANSSGDSAGAQQHKSKAYAQIAEAGPVSFPRSVCHVAADMPRLYGTANAMDAVWPASPNVCS
jgi:hypothetical protein